MKSPEPTPGSEIVACLLIVGTLVSYAPQYWLIHKRNSSFGLSFVTIAAALCASSCTGINTSALNWDKVQACAGDEKLSTCLARLLPLFQLFAIYFCNLALFVFFVVYCNPEPPAFPAHVAAKARSRSRNTLIVIVVLMVSFAAALLIMAYPLDLDGAIVKDVAKGVGYLGTVAMVTQYLPQFYTTWKLQGPGSLSVVTVMLQCSGTLIVIYYQAVLAKQDASTWAPFVVNTTEMFLLLCLIAFFRARDWLSARRGVVIAEIDPEREERARERESLLVNAAGQKE